jgi:ribonuclease G
VSKELVINVTASEVRIALLDNKRLIELQTEVPQNECSVGDFYLGKVKKLTTGLNAAFVDVGYEKDAFLHYLDLGPQVKSLHKLTDLIRKGKLPGGSLDNFRQEKDIDKGGRIDQVLKPNQNILVQITKEPISTKGPRISSELSLAGRFLVLVPFSNKISVSQKIRSRRERERLRTLIQSIKPKNFGVIIRTVAESKKVAELDKDLKDLYQKWIDLHDKMKGEKPPSKVLSELNRSAAFLRDMLSPDFNKVYINDEELFYDLKEYLETIAPERKDIINLYKGKIPIFDFFNIEKQIKAAFGKHVTMHSGAYLVIEHTEALHVVDVNSGNTSKKIENQEENALKVNLEAAEEIARQLRLRDMGGIIVVDFIDMHKSENRKTLVAKLKEFMKNDRAKHHILPPSKFGLVQITRQRVRPEMDIKTTEFIPTASGKKEVEATILIIDQIESYVQKACDSFKGKIHLKVHPFVDSYLKKGFKEYQRKWYSKHGRWINVQASYALPLVKFQLMDKDGNLLKLS